MTLPAATDVATRGQLATNDPRAPTALAIALSWARTYLARPADDTLTDLNPAGEEAVLGYAVDVLKLPALQSALTNPDNELPAQALIDLGRRWAPMLGPGNKHLWAVR